MRCSCGASFESDGRRVLCPGCGQVHDRYSQMEGATMAVASPTSWERKAPEGPLVERPLDWAYSREDLERIRWGLVPRAMEEKWFACVEGDELHLHRSWTGLHVYALRLTPTGIDRVRCAPDANIELARWIVEALLVGREWPFPWH